MWEDALADQRLRHEWGSWRSRSRRRMREGGRRVYLKNENDRRRSGGRELCKGHFGRPWLELGW